MQKFLYNGKRRSDGNILQPLIYTLLDIQKVLFKFMAMRNKWMQTDRQLDKEFIHHQQHTVILIFEVH